MGLVETFMPEEKITLTLSEIEGLIRDKERAVAKYEVLLGLCKHNLNIEPEVIYEVFTEKNEEND